MTIILQEMKKTASKKKLREELSKLDSQIETAKQIRKVLTEERKPIYTVYKWEAPERVFEEKNKSWYVVVAAVATVVIVLSAFTANFLLIFVVIAAILLLYSLGSIPPSKITHEITNKGLNIFSSLIQWKRFISFWVTKRGDTNLINFEYHEKSDDQGRRVILLEGGGDIKKIVTYLVQYIDYYTENEVQTGFITKLLEGEHIPLIKLLERIDIKTKDPKDRPKKQTKKKTTK